MTRLKIGIVRLAAPIATLLITAFAAVSVFAQQTPTPVPLPAGALLFAADFEDGSVGPWTFSTAAASVVEDDSTHALSLAGEARDGSSAVLDGSSEWTDYVVDFRLKIADVDSYNQLADLALVVRANADKSDFVAVFISSTSDRAIIGSVLDNQIVDTFGVTYPFEPNVWYNVRIRIEDDEAELLLDGQSIAVTPVTGQASNGSVGVITFLGTRVLIDSVQVIDLSGAAQPSGAATLDLSILATNTPLSAGENRLSTETPSGGAQPDVTPFATSTPRTASSGAAVVVAAVTAPTANLRSGPGAEYPAYGAAMAGTRFTVVAQTELNGERWLLVEGSNGRSAWVWADLVEITPAEAEIPPAPFIPPLTTAQP